MFEIKEFKHDDTEYATYIEDLENDVYYDIDNLLNNFDLLYKKDKFKCRGHNIDILYPQYLNPENKTFLRGPDHVRFLLSLYPAREDLNKVRCIILRPRHIEIEGAELVSLYIRKERVIVLYLHYPYLFPANNIKFYGFSEVLSSTLLSIADAVSGYIENKIDRKNIVQIPPLWYIISTISDSIDDNIEKFLVRRNNKSCISAFEKLSDISFHYSRLGY